MNKVFGKIERSFIFALKWVVPFIAFIPSIVKFKAELAGLVIKDWAAISPAMNYTLVIGCILGMAFMVIWGLVVKGYIWLINWGGNKRGVTRTRDVV